MKNRHLAVVATLGLAFVAAFGLGGGCDPCPKCSETRHSPSATPTAIQHSSSGQGLIGVDTNRNIGYVPIYPFDDGGNSQLAVVNLSPTIVATPTPTPGAAAVPSYGDVQQAPNQGMQIIKLLSLPGNKTASGQNTTVQPVACTFNVITNMIFCSGRESDDSVNVYQIDAKTEALINTIPAPSGVTQGATFGGIIANPLNNTVVVAGSSSLVLLDSSKSPPVFEPNSFVDLSASTGGTDSFALNFQTNQVLVSSDGELAVVDFSKSPPVVSPFTNSGFGTTDGCGFDTSTNMAIVSPEFQDTAFAFNFGELNVSQGTAPNVQVPGVGFTAPVGEGPGGQAVVNGVMHQFVIADEFGQNVRIGQLPLKPITGAPDNNGQPGSGTNPDANSAFTIAATLIAQGNVNGTPTQLGIVGDPNSLTMDPVLNFAYVLADTNPSFHTWSGGPAGSTPPLFLIRITLANPVFGGSSTGTKQWNPEQVLTQMPQ